MAYKTGTARMRFLNGTGIGMEYCDPSSACYTNARDELKSLRWLHDKHRDGQESIFYSETTAVPEPLDEAMCRAYAFSKGVTIANRLGVNLAIYPYNLNPSASRAIVKEIKGSAGDFIKGNPEHIEDLSRIVDSSLNVIEYVRKNYNPISSRRSEGRYISNDCLHVPRRYVDITRDSEKDKGKYHPATAQNRNLIIMASFTALYPQIESISSEYRTIAQGLREIRQTHIAIDTARWISDSAFKMRFQESKDHGSVYKWINKIAGKRMIRDRNSQIELF